ncbi:hypothetical protein HPULCUR_000181 [Helicostylum pulchrum]|uniref:Protein kinase domain-containing protein n=1 Tax=Helicostylum pulchrum TaxID=562976 RepID=A0ABP9XJ42_9FUNG
MKPENLLLDYKTGRPIIKLADFGLARELKSQPPYTEYVSTRWYRAPEVLLRSTEYSAPVDLWAIGAIFAELITLEPLFPGESEIDQLYRICDILGSPGNKLGVDVGQKKKNMRPEKRASPGFARKKVKEVPMPIECASTISFLDGGGEWKEGVKLAYKIGFKFPPLSPKPLETVIPNATENMLNLIRRFLFFNPNQRLSADGALAHDFFNEQEEPMHLTSMHVEPITPPDKCQQEIPSRHHHHHQVNKPITPLDLLSTPRTPYQICPDWETDHPVSRYGRLCSAIKDERLSSHVDRFLHDSEDSSSAWLNQSRPIYSSHQKVHPVTDRPNSSNLWNKYNYAAHQRPSTPVVDHSTIEGHGHGHHNPGPTASVSTKRYSDDFIADTHRRLGAHLHHHPDHTHHPNQIMTRPLPPPPLPPAVQHQHYGSQLIKWAPPHFTQKHAAAPITHHHVPAPPPVQAVPHQHYRQPAVVQDPELSRPESRRCRSPAPFSSQLMKHKYTTTVHTSTTTLNPASAIQCWTAPTVTTSVNTDKVFMSQEGGGGGELPNYVRKSDKPQSTHRNSTSHRFNLWVPETTEEEEEEEPKMEHDRSVFLALQ